MPPQERILVTGASGQLGQLVLQRLIDRGHSNLIATTRTPDKLGEFSQKGVDVRYADFNEPTSLDAAFAGATSLLLISTLDIGSRVEQHGHAIDAAKRAGVKHIVYTSWPHPESSVALVSPDHAGTEDLIRSSGLKYTFLANYLYSEGLMYSLPQAIQIGTLYGAAGDGKAAYVTREDCAYAAAGALRDTAQHENKTYLISGPQAYSRAELVALVSKITGKALAYAELAPDAFKAALIQGDLPEAYAAMFLSFELAIKRGEVSEISDAVVQLSGQAPTDLATFLKQSLQNK